MYPQDRLQRTAELGCHIVPGQFTPAISLRVQRTNDYAVGLDHAPDHQAENKNAQQENRRSHGRAHGLRAGNVPPHHTDAHVGRGVHPFGKLVLK